MTNKTRVDRLWPLWRQLLVAMVVSMLLVAACAGVFQYYTETQEMSLLLERQNKKNFQLLHAAVIEPIVSEDLPVLDAFVEMLAKQDQDLFSIKVFNADNKLLINWQRSKKLPEKKLMTFHDDIVLQGHVFGTLKVSWSVDHFFELIEQKILRTQLFLATMLITLICLVMVLLLKLIVNPIRLINRHVSHYLNNESKPCFTQQLSSQELSQLNVSVTILGKAYKIQAVVEKELRKTKQEVESISRLNNLILSSIGEGIFVVDSKAMTIYANSAATEMTGWSTEDLIGKGLKCLLSKQGNQASSSSKTCNGCLNEEIESSEIENCHIYDSLMKGGVGHVRNEVFWHKDGRSFQVEYVSTPVVENEHITGTVITFKDISTRLMAEQQLKDSESLQQAMLSSSLDAIITIDQEGLICEFNPAAEQMFIREKVDVLGAEMVDTLIPLGFKGESNRGLLHYLHSKNNEILRQRIEVFALRSTGEKFPIELVITPITLHKKLFYTAFISDITERQRDKTALDEARKLAERANVAKSQFLAAMSHEIRTPLNAIIGINDLLQTTELNSEQWGYVQIAEQSGLALKEITNDILDFSKIEAGKLELELHQTDLIALIDSVILIMAPKAIEKNLELAAVVNYPIPKRMLLDPVRIKQVLLNLVSNAIKFTAKGFIEIQIGIEKKASQNNSLVISVIDSGIGIAKETQKTLFDEFTQADLTITRKYGGTGLGLAIASQLVMMSGGKIGVDSVEGEGSRFWFCLDFDTETLLQFKVVGLNCWIFDRGTKGEKSAELLCKQLSPLVRQVQTVASWDDMVFSDQPSIIFIDETQLAYFSQDEIEQFLAKKQHNCSVVLVVSSLKKQLNKDWLNVCNERLVKPVAIKPLKTFLSKYSDLTETETETAKSIISYESKGEKALAGCGTKVLLVEDSVVNQLVIKVMLEKAGFSVDVAENGLRATEQTMNDSYDLILMDLSMPVMGGVEATKLIRKDSKANKNTPIIALTANAFKENREQCFQAGMNGFLAKPITMNSLNEEIEKHLFEPALVVESEVTDLSDEITDEVDSIIDYSVIEQLKQETSEAVFPTLLKAFIEQGKKRIEGIEQAIFKNDFTLLENEIHALKSESATFGAIKLAELTTHINLLCKQGMEKQAFDEAKQIKQHWVLVCDELPKYY